MFHCTYNPYSFSATVRPVSPPDSRSPQQPVCKRRQCCLLSDAPSSGFYSVAECKSAQTHTENTRPVGRGSSTTLQPPSLPMHNAWEHVNTLILTCINDHGEAHSLSTRAINKRWCTVKAHTSQSWEPPAHLPTTWSAETHFMPILNLVLFLCCLGVWYSRSRAE